MGRDEKVFERKLSRFRKATDEEVARWITQRVRGVYATPDYQVFYAEDYSKYLEDLLDGNS